MSKSPVPIAYITDCRDDNTQGRLKTRVATYFPESTIIFVGVTSNLETADAADLEAAINIVDVIDAFEGRPGMILANVAHRHGKAKRWPNGTPFGWVKVGNIDIFSTVDGYTLSLVQKMVGEKLVIKVYDIPTVVPHMELEEKVQDRIIHTQFRSLDYLPRLAAALMAGKDLPYEEYSEVSEMPMAICWVDSFGNLKTNILPEEVQFEVGKKVVIRVSENKQLRLPCYNRLKDIPDGQLAFTIGSSGMKNKRFLEIMQQGRPASEVVGIAGPTMVEFVETTD
ncbi:MAG: hypothetical protein HYV32_01905 [Candidatus Kerfeldbacteria bacterium]|nr:hypothetical protein [Candidatus Kerfeldbacteria bacterium]